MRPDHTWMLVALLAVWILPAPAQQPGPPAQGAVPNLIQFAGALHDENGKPMPGVVGVTFLLYKDQDGGAPLWMETQNVQTDKTGHYSVTLGATSSYGLPSDIFVAGEARWLAVQPQGQQEQPRAMLLSVPYALKAGDAQTIGGLPASAFVLAAPGGTPTAATESLNSSTRAGTNAPPASSNVTTTGGTVNAMPLWTTATNIQSSALTQSGTGSTAKIGINTTAPGATLDVKGSTNIQGLFTLPSTGTATATNGFNSQPQNFVASAFDSGTTSAVAQKFQWQAEAVNNNTSNASGTLNLLYGQRTNKPAETGLKIASNGQVTFAPGQTFPGTGTITGVTAGTGLSGGGSTGNITLGLVSNSCAAGNALSALPFTCSAFATLGPNTFAGNQTVSGNLSASGVVTGSSFQIGSSLFAFGSLSNSNAFLGFAGNSSATGGSNTAAGVSALANDTTGYYNTAVGSKALSNDRTGTNNIALGSGVLQLNTAGSFNTAAGFLALYNTTGSSNVAMGDFALSANTLGNNNVAIGTVAGGASPNSALTTGNSNTYVGAFTSSGTQTNLTNATAIGANAEVMANNSLVLGSINGVNGATANTSVGIGTTTPAATLDVHGTANFTGLVTFAPGQTFTTTTGAVSGEVVNATTGFDLGGALFAFGSYGNSNAFLGFAGGTSNTGGNDTAIGAGALNDDTSGSSNTAVGVLALFGNTTGSANTAVGVGALDFNSTGTNNTALGDGAGLTGDLSFITGSNNTLLGWLASLGVGSISNSTAIGAGAEVDQSNSLVLGSINGVNGATVDTNVGIGTTAPRAVFHIDHKPPSGGVDVAEITSGGSIDVASLIVQNTGSGGLRLRVGAGTGSGYLASSGPMAFITADSGSPSLPNGPAMTIDNSGNVHITGNLSKGGGSFKIDHPLDPENKYLYHSFVESPDMMNIYNGVTTLDAHGSAWITMPDYFEALNRDFRYQLTSIGRPQPSLYIAQEVSGHRFRIAGGKAGGRVCWQVTGIRHDAYADAHRIPIEEEKPRAERGHYLHPDAFGAEAETVQARN